MGRKQNILIEKIEAFTKKFYTNKLIKGIFLGCFLLIVLFLVIIGFEYIAWLPKTGRFFLLALLCGGSLLVFAFYIFIPLLNLIRFRKKMSLKQAATLIGKFFPDIEDKLLNTLNLSELLEQTPKNELLLAAIEQRTAKLSPIPFTNAIDFKTNKKHFWYLMVALLFFLALLFLIPDFVTQPVNRIVQYDKTFIKPLSFEVAFSNPVFETMQGVDYELKIEITGNEIPEMFYVVREGSKQQMKRNATNSFSFVFKKPYHDVPFAVEGGKYRSHELLLQVRSNPQLLSYQARIVYPKYVHREAEIIKEKTRFIVPEGSQIEWTFVTRDVEKLFYITENDTIALNNKNDVWTHSERLTQNAVFEILPVNQWLQSGDRAIRFEIDVQKDAYPEIEVRSFSETFDKTAYFSGLIADDYGFSKFHFVAKIVASDTKEERVITQKLDFRRNEIRQQFYHAVQFDSLQMNPGDEIVSYFEIWDNDGINGVKSKKSNFFTFSIPSVSALDSIAENRESDLNAQLEKSREETLDIQKEIEALLRELTAKKELDWSDKEKIKNLIEKQNQIHEVWNKQQQEMQKLNEFREENQLMNQELLRKQDEINKLFEEVVPEEIKKMMQELEAILEKMPRENLQKMLNDFKKDSKKMHDLLNRNLSLLEQLKVEKDISKLAEELEALAEKLENETNTTSSQEAQQEFEKLQHKLDSVQKKNESLKRPFKLEKTDNIEQEINKDLEDADKMEQQNQQQSKSKKQGAGSKMKQMSNMLTMSLQMSGQEQMTEDAHATRILLENILRSSHQQEELLLKTGKTKSNDPSMPENVRKQSELSDNFKIVEDSLHALANRQPLVQNFVFDELNNVKTNIDQTLASLQELMIPKAVSSQQYAMMAMNKLALMLTESLEQMQNSLSSSGQGKPQNQPQKQGKSEEQLSKMREMQEALGKQLQELRKQMEGQKGSEGQQSMSEELARMAAEQEAIRQQMQELSDQMKADGVPDKNLQKILEDMEKLEESIVNKQINNQTSKRQQDILSRMLESEKAQRERKKEEKRESFEYKGENFGNKIDEIEYKKTIKEQDDLLRVIPIEYQPYYKEKINRYYFRKNESK
ncbi:MAG: hypothetical protein LBM67_03235 [Lentimicrobiaceae bacterium]|jgi:hypothetical protein|nr:hypothetical protein [Lentimicrobiaceae bacterium]